MEETITRYIATITKGDEYYKEGEEHRIAEYLVERTQRYGLELEVDKDNYGVIYYRLYPCTIRRVVYKLEPIEITSLPGCDRKDIGYDEFDSSDNNDWKEHWP